MMLAIENNVLINEQVVDLDAKVQEVQTTWWAAPFSKQIQTVRNFTSQIPQVLQQKETVRKGKHQRGDLQMKRHKF